MLVEPQPTPYDLTFRVAGFPVRVHPLFWVGTALFGSSALGGENPIAFLALWIGVVFVSILVHELGHGVAFRRYGSDARISLYWLGGLAIPTGGGRTTRPWPSLVISLAGPAAGFLLAAVTYATQNRFEWAGTNDYTATLYWQLLVVNIVWGVINLFPVYPLDGGQACQAILRGLRVRRAEAISYRVSIGTASALAVYSLINTAPDVGRDLLGWVPWWARVGSLFMTLFYGSLAYSSYQALQHVNQRDRYWDYPDDDTPPWRQR